MIITVVTPTLNAEQFLEECIISVQRNCGESFQVDHVIVDGGSSDATLDIARHYRIRILSGKDSGIFDAINRGSLRSQGDLLGFLGADDLMLPGALSDVVTAYCKSGRRWVVGGIRWIDTDGDDFGGLAAPPSWMSARMHACLGWNPVMHMATYLARDFFEDLGGFDISFRDSGDYDMFARALRLTPFARLDRPLACFRHTGSNNSAVNLQRTSAENARVCAAFGPRTSFERIVWKAVLKLWFNGRNPDWVYGKLKRHLQPRSVPQRALVAGG
jgi:glycosyltransferase involved in cell wall biosynthesis